MRWKLWWRRLSVSAPRMSVRSHLPWPLRWATVALVLGFSGALALWAFDVGQRMAGLEPTTPADFWSDHRAQEAAWQRDLDAARSEREVLRSERDALRFELERLRAIANSSQSLIKAEQVVQEKLVEQVRQLQAENQTLRDDLGFFEHVFPLNPKDAVAVRGVQAERVSPTQIRYQVLLMNNQRRQPDFEGKMEIVLRGTLAGRPWTHAMPGPRELRFRQYRRMEGVIEVPVQAVVQSVQVTVVDSQGRSATQTQRI